jgi:hypothetical protein
MIFAKGREEMGYYKRPTKSRIIILGSNFGVIVVRSTENDSLS